MLFACFVFSSSDRHNHFVQDVVLSSDGQFALSASWDGTLRLWDLAQGKTHRRFVGHSKDVLSVAFSADNRQIVSGSRFVFDLFLLCLCLCFSPPNCTSLHNERTTFIKPKPKPKQTETSS